MNRSESIGNTCPVCHDDIEIYAIGPCDHPVCYRCSTRMRVLCENADCSICRSLMPQVAYIHQRSLFKEINLRDCIPNRKNKIFYEDEGIEERFLHLLEFKCRICPNRKSDRTFILLQTHMRREHQLFACDLCLSHLRIFPYERKFYDRKNLATHRRVGDSDDRSYKGHPLCEFCDVRYNDKDELMKHLRKDHFYCHFCDQQDSNAYYNEYPDLKQHFADSHFLCADGTCGDDNTRFIHAFSSEIDLKAHKATMHNKNMSKFQSRETRNIEIDFQLHPRRPAYGNRGVSNGDYHEDNHQRSRGGERYNRRQQRDDPQLQRALAESLETVSKPPPVVQERVPDPVHDFPTLSGAPAVQVPTTVSKPQAPVEDFPTLGMAKGQGGATHPQYHSKAYASVMNFQAESGNTTKDKNITSKSKSESKPVVLGTVSNKSKERWAVKAPNVTEENFPTLGGGRSASSSNSLSNMDMGSSWSKSTSHNNDVDHQVNIIPNKLFEEKTTKVKHKPPPRQLVKNIGDESEFPSLEGMSREGSALNNPMWPVAKSAKSAKSATKQPRVQKVDDDTFELPESYYKTYEPDETSNKIKHDKKGSSGWAKSDTEKAKPELNKKKDFPSLPTRETKANSGNNVDNKKKTKQKEKKSEPREEKSTPTRKSKTPGGGLSSLSDIAQGLVVNGKDTNKKSADKGKKSGNEVKSKPDWFDNPIVDQSPSQAPARPMKQKKAEDISSESVSTVDNSFPSLHTMSTPIQDNRAPPGFSGLAPKQSLTSSASGPPPGFSKSLTAPPGFSAMKSPVQYIQPADFSARNQQLIQAIYKCLDTIENGFQNFKAFSGQYRQGTMEGNEYYVKCVKLMGEEDFMGVFQELIALLPDVAKQQELWAIHQTALSNKSNKLKIGQYKKWIDSMSPCPTCGQIVSLKDEQYHILQHGEQSDFPTLGEDSRKGRQVKETHNPVKGAWIKAK